VEQGHEIGLLAIIDQARPGLRLNAVKALPAAHRILGAIPQRLRDEFAQAPPGARSRHFRRLALRWSKAIFGYRDGAASMFDLGPDKRKLIEQYDASLRAVRAYQPGRLRASLTLIRAKTTLLSHLALDSTLGWSELVDGEVRVRVVPGDHHTMATEPLVRHLAEALSEELDAAQEAARERNFPHVPPKRSASCRS
jgi:thioesterase domain-containing protein